MWSKVYILFVHGPFYITLDCVDTDYVCAGLSALTSLLLVIFWIYALLKMFENQEHGRDEYINLTNLFFLLFVQPSLNHILA